MIGEARRGVSSFSRRSFRRLIVALAVLGTVAGAACGLWLYITRNWPTTHTIDLGPRPLDAVVRLDCFEGVAPGMTKQEVVEILGPTAQVYIEDEGKEDEGERWEWGRGKGILVYYFERTRDGGNGSPEFRPNNLAASDLFREGLPFDPRDGAKHRVIFRRNQTTSLSIEVDGQTVTRINYYNE